MNRTIATTTLLASLIAISGCSSNESEAPAQPETTTSAASQGPSWLLTSAPASAVSVVEAKANAKEGDQVVIVGRIGGRAAPIGADSPVFTIVDLELEYCGQNNDDACGTPWDYCCETPDTIASNSATVQVLGDGMINPVAAGLEALDEVILVGTVGPRPNDQVFTIQATGVYRSGG